MRRTEMVRKGAAQLVSAENAVEAAICEVADLASQLGRMRLHSNLSAILGQEALSEVATGIRLLTEARGAMVRAHHRLDEVKTKIGCGAVSEGTGTDKGDSDLPATPPTGVAASHIHRVA